jgi:hypothetical protein
MTPKSERHSQILEKLAQYKTYSEIARETGVTRERICQLTQKIRNSLPKESPEYELVAKKPSKRQADILRQELLKIADRNLHISLDRKTAYENISNSTPFKFSTTKFFDIAKDLQVTFAKPDQEPNPLPSGAIFGLWEVINRSDYYSCGNILYRCKCQGCGRIKDVKKYYLLRGRSTQCKSCDARKRWANIKQQKTARQQLEAAQKESAAA